MNLWQGVRRHLRVPQRSPRYDPGERQSPPLEEEPPTVELVLPAPEPVTAIPVAPSPRSARRGLMLAAVAAIALSTAATMYFGLAGGVTGLFGGTSPNRPPVNAAPEQRAGAPPAAGPTPAPQSDVGSRQTPGARLTDGRAGPREVRTPTPASPTCRCTTPPMPTPSPADPTPSESPTAGPTGTITASPPATPEGVDVMPDTPVP